MIMLLWRTSPFQSASRHPTTAQNRHWEDGECRVRFIASSMVAPESLAEGTSVNQTGIEAQAVLDKSTEKKLSATSMPLGGKMEIRRMKTLLIFSSTTARAFRRCRDA